MPKEEERFTLEQRKELAELHDAIDEFVLDFHETHFGEILLDLTPPSGEDKQEKKPRCVYGISTEEIHEGMIACDVFSNRMNDITKGIAVRSVTNKLPNFFPSASRINVSSANSFKASSKSILQLEREINVLKDFENPDEENVKKRALLERVESFMNANEMEFIETRNRADRITFSAFDANNEPLFEGVSFFKGGVVVPFACQVRPPMQRKFRSDRIKEDEVLSLTDNFVFILKKKVQDED